MTRNSVAFIKMCKCCAPLAVLPWRRAFVAPTFRPEKYQLYYDPQQCCRHHDAMMVQVLRPTGGVGLLPIGRPLMAPWTPWPLHAAWSSACWPSLLGYSRQPNAAQASAFQAGTVWCRCACRHSSADEGAADTHIYTHTLCVYFVSPYTSNNILMTTTSPAALGLTGER